MLKAKYLDEKFEKLRNLVFTNKINGEGGARDVFAEILGLNEEFNTVIRRCSNIMIFDVHFDDLSRVIDVIDNWHYSPDNIIYSSEYRR